MILLALALAYLVGSFPTGPLVARLKGVDLQSQGSGNVGAANAFRVLGLVPGLLVLAGDLLKGILALVMAARVVPHAPPWEVLLIGLAAILGHNCSLFLRFQGGKGVATTAGVFFFLSWKATAAAFSFWVLLALLTRYASVASLAASMLLPIFLVLFQGPIHYVLFGVAVFILTLYRHQGNIRRLLEGKENKLTFGGGSVAKP